MVAIGHAVDELLEIADRVMVLRQGTRALYCDRAETSVEEVVASMVGSREAD